MSIKSNLFCLAMGISLLLSCSGRQDAAGGAETLPMTEDIAPEDTLTEEEEDLSMDEEQQPTRLDGVFSDFLFAYLHSPTLRRERTMRPMPLEHTTRPTEELDQFDAAFEFGFLSGEFFTELYGSAGEMQDEDEEDSLVSVQRINLNDGTIRNFRFARLEGRWKLTGIREETFADNVLSDFLTFYARFCSDSLFQAQSLANPLRIVMQDPDNEDESIDGTIDANQWRSFCPEMPSGIISNILREGQHYGDRRIVMRKSGLADGFQEVFTFTRTGDRWRLTTYEN